MSEVVLMTIEEIYRLAKNTLLANGCDEENAKAVADTVSKAERDGSVSHGLFRLPGYVASLRSKKVKGLWICPYGFKNWHTSSC